MSRGRRTWSVPDVGDTDCDSGDVCQGESRRVRFVGLGGATLCQSRQVGGVGGVWDVGYWGLVEARLGKSRQV